MLTYQKIDYSSVTYKMRCKGLYFTKEDEIDFDGTPLKPGTQVIVTEVQSQKMKLDGVRARWPWKGIIRSVNIGFGTYTIQVINDPKGNIDFYDQYIDHKFVTEQSKYTGKTNPVYLSQS